MGGCHQDVLHTTLSVNNIILHVKIDASKWGYDRVHAQGMKNGCDVNVASLSYHISGVPTQEALLVVWDLVFKLGAQS
jgi:hypothetical protein